MTDAMTPERLRPHLDGWLSVARRGTSFLVHLDGEWTGGTQILVGAEYVDVRVCPSELAIREELTRDRPDGRAMVVLTPVDVQSQDLLARVFKRGVRRLDAWEAVQRLFGVRQIDPLIAGEKWMAEALIEAAPLSGYERTASLALDSDRAWESLLRHRYGIETKDGLDGLLHWAASTDVARLQDRPEAEYRAVRRRLATRMVGAEPVLAAVAVGRGAQVVAIGLVTRLLLDGPAGETRAASRALAGGVVLSGWKFDERAARAFADAAESVVNALLASDRPVAHAVLRDAESVAGLLGAEPLAAASTVLQSGLRARLREFGQALAGRDSAGGIERIEAALACVRAHRVNDHDGTAEMALRVVRWMQQDLPAAPDFRAAAVDHVRDSAYADWGRTALRVVTGDDGLDEQLRLLIAAADARRRAQETHFADLLAGYTAHAAAGAEILGVEEVLERVVAPLAGSSPLLLIVLDGMSHRVACELLEDVIARGWTELRPAGHTGRTLVLSVLPSVTTFSRTSLLTGRLSKGVAGDEAKAFATHSALAGAKPLLFHKSALRDPHGGLSEALRSEIAGERRVIGAVVNAIDDHLARSDQLATPWDTSYVPVLRQLLDEARDASRLVVLASDHGHVLDRGTKQRPTTADGGERWRPVAKEAGDGEQRISGVRVLAPGGACVLAVDETIRYGPPKHGYHGGATAQEVLAPLLVLTASAGDEVSGWVEAPYDLPTWWARAEVPTVEESPSPQVPVFKPRVEESSGQLTLGASEPAVVDSLVARLEASQSFTAARAAAAKDRVPPERFTAILAALDGAGGKLLLDALARQTGISPMRLRGTLATMRLHLNVEGYDVLALNDDTGDVVLDVTLLRRQFEAG
ncbi:BREX-2 system phosphatase PglZ [Solirubrobacter taibaiensis]|nr:BREX-2 system phosphatase PglZ [Solirubrobacter taibaiensis]